MLGRNSPQQVSHRYSPGRACYERKLAEGKTPREALRSLKRRLSDAIFTQLAAAFVGIRASMPVAQHTQNTITGAMSPARPARHLDQAMVVRLRANGWTRPAPP